jgi:2-methylcitrate dehydratase PrpD
LAKRGPAGVGLLFLVAVAIVRRSMSVTDSMPSGILDPPVLDCARKISLVFDPTLNCNLELPPGRVEIVARDGRSWLVQATGFPGNPDNPMSWDDI